LILDQCGLTPQDLIPGTRYTVSEALLAVHRRLPQAGDALMAKIPVRGMRTSREAALWINIPRVLPPTCNAIIDATVGRCPRSFTFIARQGRWTRRDVPRVQQWASGTSSSSRAAMPPPP
jgi:phosphoribosylformylglycinamidine cyclo-ligase